jgi:hypothetical protein
MALCGATEASAQTIALTPGFLPDPQVMAGMAGGPAAASSLGAQCRGMIPQAPQQRVLLQSPTGFLRVWVHSNADTTLVVRGPNGQVFCNDDTFGLNPSVDLRGAPPGAYDVFVGTYSAGTPTPYTIGFSELTSSTPAPLPPNVGGMPGQMHQPPPPVVQQPAGLTLRSGFLPDPQVASGVSGGPMHARGMGRGCTGYVSTVPDQTITLTSRFNFLRIWARSDSDTTLVVRGPNGQVYCNDDTFGLNPSVDLRGARPGTYQVFVGSYSPGAGAPFELGVSELQSSTPTGAVMQAGMAAPSGNSTFAGASIRAGFMPDPQQLSGRSGGTTAARSLNPQCRGFINGVPDHVVQVTTPMSFVRFFVNSNDDTTLFIRGPRGEVYCDDDTYGLNPAIDLNGAAPGAYQVFVGSYSSGTYSNYTLGITEMRHVHP